MVRPLTARALPMVGFALLAGSLSASVDRVLVTPRCLTLQSGQSCSFQARRTSDPAPGLTPPGAPWRWSLPDGGAGTLQEATGVYTAPHVTGIQRIRIRATPSPEANGAPAVPGEAWVILLPTEPFDLVAKVMGADWLEPFAQDYPFLDLATGERVLTQGRAARVLGSRKDSKRLFTGYGLPTTLAWRPSSGAVAQLLSFRDGDQVVQRDVTGQAEQTLAFRAPVRHCAVEALELASEPKGHWISCTHPFQVDVRGLFPFAGNPLTAAHHADGCGLSARFREAFHAVWLWQRDEETGTWGLFHVSDPQTHVLRLINPKGRVTTLCGEPGRPGHQDSPAAPGGRDSPGLLQRLWSRFCGPQVTPPPVPVRFNRPTYLARWEKPSIHLPAGWETLVADSGNHVLRRVDEKGSVATLAGVPGQAGHRDSEDPHTALFHDPQGIAADSRSRVYVADRGNQVIRRISSVGVFTLAGSPGQSGTLDGIASAARFTDLKGIAWAPSPGPDGNLFVLDGHALRRISLEDLVVTTLVGRVDRPGFQDIGPRAEGPAALRQPCLRDPVGVHHQRDHTLLLADRGNHAIRQVDLRRGVLRTLAGDPAEPEHRWGLPRDGMPGPLGPAYAALEGPTAVTLGIHGNRDGLVVCSGRAVLNFCEQVLDRDIPTVARLEVVPARQYESVLASFSLLSDNSQGWPTMRAFSYTVDFLDPSGELSERHQGEGSSLAPVTVQGSFTAPGEGTVLVQCCTDEGVSAGARVGVTVAP